MHVPSLLFQKAENLHNWNHIPITAAAISHISASSVMKSFLQSLESVLGPIFYWNIKSNEGLEAL